MIFCYFCTKYELICSFNTFCTCIRPYYVQKTYKTTYEFIFSLHSSGESGPCDAPASAVRDVTRCFPVSRRTGDRSLYLSGVLRVGDPDLYVLYCYFCTKYELICSFNTFCTCIRPYYVQKTYTITYEFHFQFGFSRRVQAVTSSRSFPVSRRPGEHSLYVSGVLRGGDPVLYVIFCHFCTKYELISSFYTFCTCIRPYYVQKTYKTTYEFHFQLGFSRRVGSVTSHGVSPHFAGRGTDHYIFRAFSESETTFCTLFTVFSVLNTN